VFTGSVIILAIAWCTAPWVGVGSNVQALAVGALWLGLMLGFDLAIGRLVFRFPWARILHEFDPTKGGFLGFGMLVLLSAPFASAKARGLI